MLKSFPSRGRGWGHHLDTFRPAPWESCDTSTGHCLTRWSWEHNLFMALISFTILNKVSFILFSWHIYKLHLFSFFINVPTYLNDLVYDPDQIPQLSFIYIRDPLHLVWPGSNYQGVQGAHAGSVLIIATRTLLIITTDQFSHLSRNIKMISFFCYQLFFRLLKYFSQGIFLSSISECRKRGRCWRWIIGCSHWRWDHNCWLMASDPIPGVPECHEWSNADTDHHLCVILSNGQAYQPGNRVSGDPPGPSHRE